MAIYKLDPATGIETVSGAISRHRLPDGSVEAWIMTKKGRMYHRVYRRTKPLSENEAIHRALFKNHLFKPGSAWKPGTNAVIGISSKRCMRS